MFGDSQNDALHFDAMMAAILEENQEKYSQYSDFDPQYVTDYQEYETSVDDWGSDSLTRQNMYNPMYFLSDYYDGWRLPPTGGVPLANPHGHYPGGYSADC